MNTAQQELKELISNAQYNQITVSNFLSNRYYKTGEGWTDLKLSDEAETELINGFISSLGGREATRKKMYYALSYKRVNDCGILQRVICHFNNDNDKEIRFSYVAGQDYSGELQYIRRYLTK